MPTPILLRTGGRRLVPIRLGVARACRWKGVFSFEQWVTAYHLFLLILSAFSDCCCYAVIMFLFMLLVGLLFFIVWLIWFIVLLFLFRLPAAEMRTKVPVSVNIWQRLKHVYMFTGPADCNHCNCNHTSCSEFSTFELLTIIFAFLRGGTGLASATGGRGLQLFMSAVVQFFQIELLRTFQTRLYHHLIYYITLSYVVLYYTIPYYTMLCYTILCYTIYYTTLLLLLLLLLRIIIMLQYNIV